MRIIHVCLSGLYMSGWGYQDNLIVKYQLRDGHEVGVIANKYVYDSEGSYLGVTESRETDENGALIFRLDQKGNKKLKGPAERVHYKGLYKCLEEFNPDIIFLHNPQILDTGDIAAYIRDRRKASGKVRLYVDSHSDYSNSGRNALSKYILHGMLWRSRVKKLIPYTEKFYGVLPARVDFLLDRYKTPKDRTTLLLMGMDDERALEAEKKKSLIREKYGITEEDFLIVTGGKIDHAKRQTLLLIEAVKRLNNPSVKLLVFGSVVNDMREEFDKACSGSKEIIYTGWIKEEESYAFFAAADFVIFPGRHSVMWEQVAGQGKPMAVKYWEGTTHIDMGGNCVFLKEDSIDEIKELIESVCDRGDKYKEMLNRALSDERFKFSYRTIARKCIEEKAEQ